MLHYLFKQCQISFKDHLPGNVDALAIFLKLAQLFKTTHNKVKLDNILITILPLHYRGCNVLIKLQAYASMFCL